MHGRRAFQSLLGLAACVALAADLGHFYFLFAFVAIIIAVSAGVYIMSAIALGLVWPVLALAFVVHTTRGMRLRTEEMRRTTTSHHATRRPTSGEPDLSRVEDP